MNHNYPQSFQDGTDPNAAPFNPAAYYYNPPADQHHAHNSNGPNELQQQQQLDNSSYWYEVSCLRAGAPGHEVPDAIHTLAFDPIKELTWVGTASGMVHSHHAADMSRIVSSYIAESSSTLSASCDVRDLVISESSVLAAMGYGLAVVSRGGVLKSTVRADTVKDAKALALNPLSDRHVCMGGESSMLAVIDLESSRILRQATLRGAASVTGAEWAAPDGASNTAIFSTATGRISLCDPSSMREIDAIAAFAGAATSIATSGYYLAATGLGTRGGVSYLEQHVKFFDIRNTRLSLPPVVFPAPPMFVSFDSHSAGMYNANGALWVLAPNGLLQLLDTSGIGSGTPPEPLCNEIQLDAGTDMLTCMAVSSQGLLVMGDSGGFVHQWTASQSVKVNIDSEPIWTVPVPTEPPKPSISLDELLTSDIGTSIPKCAIPEFDNGYLSKELFESPVNESNSRDSRIIRAPTHKDELQAAPDFYPRKPFARFPLVISDDILARAQQSQSIIGYAQAPPGFKRNSHVGHKKPTIVRGLKASSAKNRTARAKKDRTSESDQGGSGRRKSPTLDLSKPAAKSSYVEMDLVAWESSEGFDFLKYNRSGLFCGLENALPNVYVNAVVQMLYFTPPIRIAVGNHVCNRDWCITCELGFLFHMFDLGGAGMACEAGNFTRAFMTMANAGALGLLDGPHALPLAQRMENFSRYLLEQLHKDEELSGGKAVPQIFGAHTVSFGTFMSSKTKWERQSLPFQHTLSYDGAENGATYFDVLKQSLSHGLDPTRAFCEASGQFETMTQRRELRSLPNVLMLGCNTKAKQYTSWWLQNEDTSCERTAIMRSRSGESFGVGKDGSSLDEIASKAMEEEKRLIQSMRVDIKEEISVTEMVDEATFGYDYGYDKDGDDQIEDTGNQEAIYDLSFVIALVSPTSNKSDDDGTQRKVRNVEGHVVAYIRVPREYREKDDFTDGFSDKAEWWCFNDFVISPCSGFDEVSAFHSAWKTPCLLGYVRRDVKKRVGYSDWDMAKGPVNVAEVIGTESSNEALGLQPDEEPPGKGSVLALDCEFVMVGRDEADIFGDGTREVIVPARMALARVSVIRGYGKYKGAAIIDDYVAVREPVVDYVTRFSGLVEGDLQEGRSRYTVSSLKSVYKRLRCLVDAGCVFVGHGLKSDFRIINFVVPPEQVIDTVTIFRVSNKRLLGLRFLSHALLGDDIQGETHDSIEDSRAALGLYEFYLRLKEGEHGEERFNKTLKDLYTYGYANGFRVAVDNPFNVDWGGGRVPGER